MRLLRLLRLQQSHRIRRRNVFDAGAGLDRKRKERSGKGPCSHGFMMELERVLPLVLVGAGRMGSALLRGWLHKGLPETGVTVVEPRLAAPAAALFNKWAVRHVVALQEPVSAGYLVLAIKPQAMGEAMARIAPLLGDDVVVVSIAAGTTIATLEAGLGRRPIVRAMPNTPAQVGQGVTALFANAQVSGDMFAGAEALMAAVGQTVRVDDEALMDAVTAVSGSGPAYVFYLVECLARAGEAAGLPPDTAQVLARQTICGAAGLLAEGAREAADLRRDVTSPGGTTAAALAVLRDDNAGLAALMQRAVEAAAARSRALGKST